MKHGMPQGLIQGSSTYTSDRVLRVLQDGLLKPIVYVPGHDGVPPEFGVSKAGIISRKDGWVIYHTLDERRQEASSWCQAYLELSRNPTDHLLKLDHKHNELLLCSFQPREPHETIVERVVQLLSRLPSTPPELGIQAEKRCSGVSDEYFLPNTARTWENLQVTSFVSTNTIRLALQMEMAGDYYWANIFREFVDTLSELLEAALSLAMSSDQDAQALFVLQSFLWMSWQRAVMLQFSYLLDGHLRIGYDYGRNRALFLEGTGALQTAIRKFGTVNQESNIPQYMCKWAFESLRSDRASVALDFRTFFERYTWLYGDRSACCLVSSTGTRRQCDGRSPGTCQRFVGRKIDDQSAHSTICTKKCSKLFWDEQSFRRQTGARAVSIDADNTSSLHYCTASKSTMAISHVWSHGQGGRPEHLEHRGTGFNSCLHERYTKLARNFGCDSYWMDTPCIPQDHKLRKEAIMNINSVFANSRCTLICDIDLIQIDVSEPTLELREAILAALLVCDWNVRAWTLLEAMRGRHNIQILFRDEKVLSLKEILEVVHKQGSIALAALFTTAQHLLPAQPPPPDAPQHQYLDNRAKGYVSVTEAASLLSHRHASRKDDEVIIWSLLCGEEVQNNGLEFWQHQADQVVFTGFLISSNPRLAVTGFGWAPSRPNMPIIRKGRRGKDFFADDGTRTHAGLVTKEGLRATWLMANFKGGVPSVCEGAAKVVSSEASPTTHLLRHIAYRFLKPYFWGALLQAMDEYSTDKPIRYRGDADGPVFAVVGSQDRRKWHWRGIYEWDPSVALPEFTNREILLV